jgi:glycosyltransferase involved in cell wall biosynthesis
MGDKEKWNKMSLKCKKFTNKYHWDTISSKWAEYFDEPVSKPLVTIYTPSIREGWWRIMSENIAKQSYSNIEWVIVDDYPEDRSDIAKKYADNYNLNIHYLRGDKGTGRNSYSRRCGLVRANNLAWKAMKGELLVFLQDFILMPQNGIEQLVDIYRHNPDALIAPTDVRYLCSEPDRTNKEDWWNGKTDVLTTLDWTNARNLNLGMRESENPFEFETNYAAMPKKILDELNGFWEFFDDGLGYDNTEICLRAFKLGYRLIVDDTNVCKAINLWTYIKGEAQNVSGRERILNTPRWQWFINSELPPVRDEKVDASINLKFEVPREIEDKDCATWINGNAERISKEWK